MRPRAERGGHARCSPSATGAGYDGWPPCAVRRVLLASRPVRCALQTRTGSLRRVVAAPVCRDRGARLLRTVDHGAAARSRGSRAHADELAESLRGARVLYNTYWVRFNHRMFTFDQAVANTKALFEAARRAGVERIVHVSILKPDEGRHLAYCRGKAELERALRGLGVSHAILRPGVLFGRVDILVNNIAWPCVGSRSSGCSAMARTSCSRCTWTISPSWRSGVRMKMRT